MDQVAKVATVVLATYEDEVAMHHCQSVRDAATRLADLGVPEVVVKSGAEGAHVHISGDSVHIPASHVERVVDTTAAGDAFAGGYLAARVGASRPPRLPGSRPTSRPPSSPTPERLSLHRSR